MPKLLFFIFLSFSSLAQIQKNQIEFLEDEAGIIDIDKAIKSNSYKSVKNKIPSLGIFPHPVWSRIDVTNNGKAKHNYYAQILLPYMDTVQYFLVKKGNIVGISEKKGWWSNVDNKHFNSPNHPFLFSLNPNENVVVYARTVKTHGTVRIPFQIETQENFLQDIYLKNAFFGWFLGMAFLIVLLNIFMFLQLKERIYLVYTLYVVCEVFSFLMRESFQVQIFNKGIGPFTGLNFYYFGLILMVMANLNFTHSFLNVKKLQPKFINRAYYTLLLLGLIQIVFQCFPDHLNISKTPFYTYFLTLTYFSSVSLSFVMFIYAIVKNKERMSAIIYSISGIPLLVLSAVQLLANMQLLPVNTAYRGVYLILGMAFEMIVLCFWLAHRFKQFSNDREKLLKEKSVQQQIALETGLRLQNQERSRLAKELHDGLGIDISIIKMKLEALGLDFDKRGDRSKEFSEAITNLDNLASNVRSFSHNIMPPDLEKNGIAVVLQNLVYNLQKLNEKIEINFTSNITAKLDDNLSQNLFFIAKELINNALRHSNASIIDVELMNENSQTELKVSDNGVGYDFEKSLKSDGMGLESIKSRVALLNANLEVLKKPFGGISHKITHLN